MLKAISFAVATVIIPFANYTHSQAIATTPTTYQISQNTAKSAKITYDRIGVGGIKLSMSEAQVRKILGKPLQVSDSFLGAIGKTRTLKYSGITVELGEGSKPGSYNVYQIKANGSGYATPDGVKIGDSQSKLIKTYGKRKPSKNGNVSRFNYSISNPSPTIFIFTVKNSKVIEIECLDVLS